MSGDDRERETLGLGDMKFDAEGLIPAVVQQHDTGEVLMVAWMNAESLARTCETRKTWFWSRSRQKYWMKGEESGNTQEVRELRYDCDADTLLVLVDAAGPACHTGESTCFYRSLCGEGGAARAAVTAGAGGAAAPRIGDVLDELFAVIESRRDASAEESYTAKLLQGPADKLLKKIGEEATEVVIAAGAHDRDQLRYEAADLVYHLLVTLAREGLTPADLAAELAKRRK
jgi:phosphoribosyl-ATP pyrophosphohydrolase/phosphoribosyl-AMP cyclohydrolase